MATGLRWPSCRARLESESNWPASDSIPGDANEATAGRRSGTMAQATSGREVHLRREIECPHCAMGPHRVELVAEVTRGTLLFGGPGVETAAPAQVSVACPV